MSHLGDGVPIAELACLRCGYVFDAVSGIDEAADAAPSDGAVSICLACGALGIFTGSPLGLRECTPDETTELLANPSIMQALVARATAQAAAGPGGWVGGR